MAIFSKKYTFFFILILLAGATKAQEILPGITGRTNIICLQPTSIFSALMIV
jgi:hypothetical protein